MKLDTVDLSELMAAEYARTNGYQASKIMQAHEYMEEAINYLQIADGFGLELLDFSVLSPRPYKYYIVLLVRTKSSLKDMDIRIKSPHYIKLMQAEFDRAEPENPIMELSITKIANHYLISFYGEV